MNKIQRTQEYYQLLIDKFSTSGRSPHQKQVYEEIKSLVGTCSSLEEIQAKMKAQGYYEKPGQALFLDKMASLRDAAKENGFPEVAATYDQKYNEVKQDFSQAYATGYEQEVSRKLGKRGQIVGAVNSLFQNYLQFLARTDYDNPQTYTDRVKQAAHEIHGYGSDIETALKDSYYQEHIPLTGQEYQEFTSLTLNMYNGNTHSLFNPETCDQEFSSIWAEIKENKDRIKEIGKSENARSKRKVYLALPPEEKGQDYRFVEPKEEGR